MMLPRKPVAILALLCLLLIAGQPRALAQAAPSGTDQPLFLEVAGDGSTLNLTAPEVIRSRTVLVNQAALRPAENKPPAAQLVLNLFGSASWLAVQSRVESNPSGSYTWLGTLAGLPGSSVILVVRDGLITGKVATPGDIYTISHAGSALHAIKEVDPQVTNPETGEDTVLPPPELLAASAAEAAAAPAAVAVASDDGSILDLMVVYTADARSAAGGTAAMESLIELGVAETNLAYSQSGVTQRLFLVHMEEVAYTESGNIGIDLPRLATVGDGFLDVVHTLRNTYHADFVKLVAATGGTGLGYLQDPAPNPGFVTAAFNVTNYSAITPNYTFAHELGHNMGLRHDWYVDNTATPFPYAHGYADRSEGWRTIMSYNDVCSDAATFCTRLLYFSNPANSFNGNPLGVAGSTPVNCVETSYAPDPESCVADSVTVLNATAANNAAFRSSANTWVGTTGDWNTPSNWSAGIAPRFLDDIVIPATPSGGNFPTTGGTVAVRNVTIENGASVTMSGGTLTVFGDWDEQGSGLFNGTGGTLIFQGLQPQTITQSAGSSFNNLQIGDGTGSAALALGANLDVNGDLIIKAGSTLSGGAQTISVGGNWDDEGNGFRPGTSTVIFDGATQTADKVTTSTVLSQDFNVYTTCGCTSGAPAGWAREASAGFGYLFGKLTSAPDGAAVLWDDTVAPNTGWLFSAAVYLEPGVDYDLSFKTADYFGAATYTVAAYLGSAQNSGAMTTLIGTAADPPGTNVYQTTALSFTVNSAGTYYLGWKGSQTTFYGLLDDVLLTGTQALTFYDLQVSATAAATFNEDVVVQNDLTTHSGGAMNLNGNVVSVEGSVTNNGILRDSRDAPNGTPTSFLTIQNAAADATKYQGVTITPTGGSLGSTTVAVTGNTACTSDPTSAAVLRCFNIIPTTANAATIRFYYLPAEANGNLEGGLSLFHWNGSGWDLETGAYSYSSGGNPRYVQVTGVSSFSPFVLDDTIPTAVTLGRPQQSAAAGRWVLPLILVLLGVMTTLIWWRRTDRTRPV